jgi:hypothetical protein
MTAIVKIRLSFWGILDMIVTDTEPALKARFHDLSTSKEEMRDVKYGKR